MRLALGSVQFGLDYGVSNRGGRCSPAEVQRILTSARSAGVDLLDTAPAYGDAEARVGEAMERIGAFRVVTKTRRPAAHGVAAGMTASLRHLRQGSVYGLLVHDACDLLGSDGPATYREMQTLRDEGLVAKIGASVYTGTEIDELLSRFHLDLVQVPINLLDQRLIRQGQMRRLKDRGVEVHARSVFLQGLLLMPLAEVPAHLDRLAPVLTRYHEALRSAHLSPVAGALAFAHAVAEIDYAVVGVNTRAEFEEIAAANRRASTHALDWSEFAVADESLINPSLWPLKAAAAQAAHHPR